MSDRPDDPRVVFARVLDAGDELELVRADGPLVIASVIAIDGVDTQLAVTPDSLPVGALATARVHHSGQAWFATFVVLDVTTRERDDLAHARIGDATTVETERWSERVAVVSPAVVRPDRGADVVIRCQSIDISMTGAALRVLDDPPPAGTLAGVVLAGDGDGSIAFRARISRVRRVVGGALIGVEVIGISRDDHRRLARLVERHRDAGSQ